MKKIRLYAGLCLFFSLFCISCKKKTVENNSQTEIKSVSSTHKWFYFNDGDLVPVDKPQNVPMKGSLPWTEAIRISSGNNSADSAYALVNRVGVLCFDNDKFYLAKDNLLFSDRTADNLVFFNDTPIFSVYKSAFFNDTINSVDYKTDDSQHYFLLQFDKTAKISYPLVNTTNISDLKNTEVVDYSWDGTNWICCLKTIGTEKTSFSYVKWTPSLPILSLSPVNATDSIITLPSDVSTFRKLKEQIPYSQAPERVSRLLAGFSSKIPFSITVKTAGGYSNREYSNTVKGSTEQELKATAILSESWSAALFEDGTLFIEGALPGRHVLRGGKPIAILLPKLPPNFVYSDFVISGTTLYAAWEESSFYKIGRTGMLSVDLDKTLYKKIR